MHFLERKTRAATTRRTHTGVAGRRVDSQAHSSEQTSGTQQELPADERKYAEGCRTLTADSATLQNSGDPRKRDRGRRRMRTTPNLYYFTHKCACSTRRWSNLHVLSAKSSRTYLANTFSQIFNNLCGQVYFIICLLKYLESFILF